MKIVIAGGTGFIGARLINQLIAAGDDVTVLTRSSVTPKAKGVKAIQWDGRTQGAWTKAIDGADAIINLCGAGIADKRWSKKQKALLRSSRLDPTRAIVQAIRSAKEKPKVLISASAVGFYGVVHEEEVDEKRIQGKGFLADLSSDWESVAREVEVLGVRLVLPRIGIVLGPGKGALQKMIPPFQFFMGGPLGSGRQWFPWIHVQDVVSLIFFALKNETVSGPMNVCAPYPVRMEEFCATLGRALNRPSWIAVPGWILKILLGEMADMLLGGQQALPRKALQLKFKFRYAFLESALHSVLSSK